MGMYILTLLALLLSLALGGPPLSHATTYHVAPEPTGQPGVTCGQAQNPSTPLSTINGAIGCMSGGDTVIVHGGTYYNEFFSEGLSGSPGTPIPAGSSWAQPTIIKGAEGETVWLRYTTSNPAGYSGAGAFTFTGDQTNYIQFERLNLDMGDNGQGAAIWISGRSLKFRDMEIKNVPRIPLQGGGTGDVHFVNLHVHHYGTTCEHAAGCHGVYTIESGPMVIDGCEFHHDNRDAGGYGIQLCSEGKCIEAIIRNTTVWEVTKGAVSYGGGKTQTYYNNVFYQIAENRIELGAGARFYNNTLHNTGIVQQHSGGGMSFGNNILLGTNAIISVGEGGTPSPEILGPNMCASPGPYGCDLTGTPTGIWVDPNANDYRLKPSTNAIDTGADLSGTFTADMTGTPRQTPWDLGACQYSAAGTVCQAAAVAPPEPPKPMPPVPDYLAFEDDPPQGTPAGAIMAPIIVAIKDASGATVPTSTRTVTIALHANPAAGTLSCGPLTCTRAAVAGRATFDGLSVDKAGSGYTFGATSPTPAPALDPDQSGTFTITSVESIPAPTDLTISTFSTGYFLQSR